MTGTTAELRTMSLADLATVQRKIAAELSRRLAGRSVSRQIAKTPECQMQDDSRLDLHAEPDFWHAIDAEPDAFAIW